MGAKHRKTAVILEDQLEGGGGGDSRVEGTGAAAEGQSSATREKSSKAKGGTES
jgi:hypothetical protein